MPDDDPPLLERDTELAALRGALADMPAVVLVEGEPGAGRSRLVREALARPSPPGRQQLTGHARPGGDVSPLAPVLEALATARLPEPARTRGLHPLTGALRAVLPDHAALLPEEPPPLGDAGPARHRLLRAALEFVAGIGPVVLVIEDLHRADAATFEFLGLLAVRRPPDVSVVLTSCPYEQPCDARLSGLLAGPLGALLAVHVRLAPLSRHATARLASTVLGGPAEKAGLSSDLADLLYERTAGVPLATCEDARHLREHGLVRRTGAGWALVKGPSNKVTSAPADRPVLPVPPRIAAGVIYRVSRLSDQARSLLDAAAVLGEPADPGLLAEVAGVHEEHVTVPLTEAFESGLVRTAENAGVTFRHGLVREAVYHAMPAPRRRRLHGVAAAVLSATGHEVRGSQPARHDQVAQLHQEAQPHQDAQPCQHARHLRIARHHRLAGNTAAWTRCAEAAADAAAERGDVSTAWSLLHDVLRTDGLPDARRVEMTVKLGWHAVGDPGQVEATDALLLAASTCPAASGHQRAELRLLRAWLRSDTVQDATPDASRRTGEDGPGSEPDWAGELQDAVHELADRPNLRAVASAILAQPNRLPGLALPDQLRQLCGARAVDTTDPVALAIVTGSAIAVLAATGDAGAWDAVDELARPGPSAQVNRQIVRGLLQAAGGALHLGHHHRALRYAERGLRVAQDAGLHAYVPDLEITRARARWTMGEPDAEQDVPLPAVPCVPVGRAHPWLHSQLLAGQVLTGQGQLDAARPYLRAAVRAACEVGELAVAGYAAAELNRAAVTAADRRDAAVVAGSVVDAIAAKQVWLWAAPLLPFAPLGLVRNVVSRRRRNLIKADAPHAEAALSYADGRLAEAAGTVERAIACFASARERYEKLPDPRMAGHAAAAEVRCQLVAGRPPDTDLLRGALATFDSLGARWDAGRLKQLSRRAGLSTPHGRGRPGYGNRLSPREREVAEFAAAGQTNRDIANRLYLSDRTVKYHLANAMRKLGITSRRELSAVLTPDGDAAVTAARDHQCRCVRCGRPLNLPAVDG